MKNMLIRKVIPEDLAALYGIAAAMKTAHEDRYYERCLEEQAAGRRDIIVAADEGGALLGYAQINWQPVYAPFRRLGMPEVQDLNVIPQARRQGIGNLLVAWCEDAARAAGKTEIGIGVGLYARFGAAQRLYVRRGYVPDGAGVAYDDVPVSPGEVRAVDDLLTLRLVKSLS